MKKINFKAKLKKALVFLMHHTALVIAVCLLLYIVSYFPDLRNWIENFKFKSL